MGERGINVSGGQKQARHMLLCSFLNLNFNLSLSRCRQVLTGTSFVHEYVTLGNEGDAARGDLGPDVKALRLPSALALQVHP